MLILTRRVGEALFINGAQIKVKILEATQDSQVNIAVLAPDNVAVHREEVYHKIQREKANDKPPEYEPGDLKSFEYLDEDSQVKTKVKVKKKRNFVLPESVD